MWHTDNTFNSIAVTAATGNAIVSWHFSQRDSHLYVYRCIPLYILLLRCEQIARGKAARMRVARLRRETAVRSASNLIGKVTLYILLLMLLLLPALSVFAIYETCWQ
jgi:hypothetical protein